MHHDFHAMIDGKERIARVLAADAAGEMLMQVGVKFYQRSWTGVEFTHPRYLLGQVRTLVIAGIRAERRMPAWMLADVLQEMRIPEDMCEVVRQSQLQILGENWRKAGEEWPLHLS